MSCETSSALVIGLQGRTVSRDACRVVDDLKSALTFVTESELVRLLAPCYAEIAGNAVDSEMRSRCCRTGRGSASQLWPTGRDRLNAQVSCETSCALGIGLQSRTLSANACRVVADLNTPVTFVTEPEPVCWHGSCRGDPLRCRPRLSRAVATSLKARGKVRGLAGKTRLLAGQSAIAASLSPTPRSRNASAGSGVTLRVG